MSGEREASGTGSLPGKATCGIGNGLAGPPGSSTLLNMISFSPKRGAKLERRASHGGEQEVKR